MPFQNETYIKIFITSLFILIFSSVIVNAIEAMRSSTTGSGILFAVCWISLVVGVFALWKINSIKIDPFQLANSHFDSAMLPPTPKLENHP
ncbi:MAG: hypothetical protein ACTSRK_03860 [Promethearchaeota archaeon]